MRSLERSLQRNLAVTLAAVMLLIWLVGSLFPHSETYSEHSAETCVPTEGVSCPPTTAVYPQKHRFKWLFPILAGTGIMLVLLVQGVVIRRTFKRLDRIRHEVRQLETGEINSLNEVVPSEIYPIVHEFNHVLSLMQERLERSRHSLGNLAHALKGPINLLVQSLDQEASNEHIQQARQQVRRIRSLTERELKRARMAGLGNTTQRFVPREDMPTLIEVLAKVHRKPAGSLQLDIDPAITRFGDREDMLELVGNLLDNACKWAESQVVCRIYPDEGRVYILIEDDGQGRDEQELQQMTERGTRLDESVEGHGLGLAICKDIVKLYGGELQFGRSERLGGLRVKAVLTVNSRGERQAA